MQGDRAHAMRPNPILRRENRIRTIHSSLAIEQNTLTLDQVTDVINGKRILGPPQDIREVKNAYEAYERVSMLDPYNVKNLLLAHRIMMEGLVKSCVFYYEFEFIHPFADGNGRTGRLWQSLILQKWKEIFAWIPVETLVYENQDEYYKVLQRADHAGDSTEFVAFMPGMIRSALLAWIKALHLLTPHPAIAAIFSEVFSCLENTAHILRHKYSYPPEASVLPLHHSYHCIRGFQ